MRDLIKNVPNEGKEEAETQIAYLINGQTNLDDAKNVLREIGERYKPDSDGIEIKFRTNKSKLLDAFKEELGEKAQSLKNSEAEDVIVSVKISS